MGVISDLRGRTFGHLSISTRAQPEIRGGYAWWPCTCECGGKIWAPGNKLQGGRVVSCGCYRADPAVRRAARLRIPARRRREIARMGAAARAKGRV
jgi:hypothetical protein